jgi:pimeloyl-ACP methyl ester carboxylesterase
MESKFVKAGDVQLEYFEQGHGLDTLVLVHGYASSAAICGLRLESGHSIGAVQRDGLGLRPENAESCVEESPQVAAEIPPTPLS